MQFVPHTEQSSVHHKEQSFNTAYITYNCLLLISYKTHKYIVNAEFLILQQVVYTVYVVSMSTLYFNYISAEYYTQAMDKMNTVFNLPNQPMYTVYTQQYNFYPSYRFQQGHHHHQGVKNT